MELIHVSLEAFEGPLDLLLHLIDKNEIDIYDIPIARLTDQYMACMEEFTNKDMEQLSEFLVMAATLLEIKSKMLLPPLPKSVDKSAEAEIDPREELVNRLIEYKRFRKAVYVFKDREAAARQYMYRAPEHFLINIMKTQDSVNFGDLLEGLSMEKLYAIFDETLQKRELKTDVIRSGFKSIVKDIYTVEEKMDYVLDLLTIHVQINFFELFGGSAPKTEKVTTFLAILELTKLKKIKIQQTNIFDDIVIHLYHALKS